MNAHLENVQLAAYRVISQVPDVGPADAPPELKEKVSQLLGFVFFGVASLAVAAVMGAAVSMFFAHRNGTASEHAKTLGFIALGCSIAAGASGLVRWLM